MPAPLSFVREMWYTVGKETEGEPMLQILQSTDQRTLRREILRRICDQAGQGVTGQILVVPEQDSHEAERSLCRAGGDTISRSAEVLSFTRLADRVCACCGGVSRPVLDKGGRLIAMSLALEQVGSRLKLYGSGRKKPEFLLRILSVLEELKSAKVSSAQLQQASSRAQGQLAVKLEELSLIRESLDTVCAVVGQDANDRLELLDELLETYGYGQGRRIYVLGFSDFTAVEAAVLGTLLGQAEEVTVALLGDGTDRGPFAVSAGTVRQLKSLASAWQIPVKRTQIEAPEERDPALTHLCRHLFGGGVQPWTEPTDALELHHSAGIHGACMEVAGRIQRLAEAGWRYRDMGICCTDPELYRPVLESVFARFSIPLYVAGADPLESDPVTGMLCAALDAATGGMETEDVLRFLKSGLSRLEPELGDQLENYARTWRIRGRKWETVWDMHPDGYGLPMDETVSARLELLNEARARSIAPLTALRDALRAAADTAGQVEALYSFLEAIDLAGTLEAMQDACRSASELRQAQAYGQIYELTVQALEQLHRVLGKTVREPEDFSALVSAVLSCYSVGTIPANLDSVTAGSPGAMRYDDCRALFLLGADDGAFPAYQPESSLLTEQDRKQLMELGVSIAPGRSLQLDRELTVLYQALSVPREFLFVDYCSEQPSYLFSRMRELFPALPLGEDAALPEITCYDSAALTEAAALGNPAAEALLAAAAPEREADVREIRSRASYRMGELEPKGVEGLYGEKLYLSASRMDQYAACRCAYFLRYGLRLKPQKEAAFDAPVYGTFVHAVLEKTAAKVRGEGGFHQVEEARLLDIAREMMDSYEDETLQRMLERSPRLQYLFERNRQEVLDVVRELGRELRTSDFEPAGFEVEFSAAGQMAPVEIQGETARAELSGFVDRVDLYTSGGVTYVRVVDYKTGKKAFDYTDILNGMGLQMLIYLFALEEHGSEAFGKKLQPAGVLYFPARRPILPVSGHLTAEEADEKRRTELTRQGILAKDETVLRAMEHFDKKPVYMPFQLDASGEPKGDLADLGEMRLLRDHVKRVLAKMADDLHGGAVEPNPILRGPEDGACTYCDYAQVCHRASGEVPGRPMRKTERKTFWNLLEKEAENHG